MLARPSPVHREIRAQLVPSVRGRLVADRESLHFGEKLSRPSQSCAQVVRVVEPHGLDGALRELNSYRAT